jgi:hypothetical protein
MTVDATEGCINKHCINRTGKWLHVRHNTIFENGQLMKVVAASGKQDNMAGMEKFKHKTMSSDVMYVY